MRLTPKNRTALLLATAVLSAVAGACSSDAGAGSAGSESDRVQVVAAFYPLAFAAERIGGDLVEVTNITAAGVEPHDLELTSADVDRVESADLVLYVPGFQPAIDKVAKRRGDAALDIFGGEHEHGHTDGAEEHSDGDLENDPHFWLAPNEYLEAVEAIEGALVKLVGDADAATVEANADALRRDLEALDEEFGLGLSECTRRAFVTSHAAFGHLAERYDLEQLAISGLSPESEPSPARLDELADQIEAEGITTVFYEELVAPDVAETLAREVGVDTAVLSPLEGLTPEQVDSGEDYFSVMRDNLSALRRALECS